MDSEKVVLDRDEMRRTLVRIAHEILERNDPATLAVVGIHRRGAELAGRLCVQIAELAGVTVPLGDLDIAFYRDDIATRAREAAIGLEGESRAVPTPIVHASHIDFGLEGRTVIIVDDVLFTGRTVRAAIEALFDYGRPARVQLAVMADRGHRELPIRPDYVGKNLPTARSELVVVRVEELDGVDEVAIAAPREVAA